MRSDRWQGDSWAGQLCHPVPLVAVLALAVNDHLLKGSGLLPKALTGKLSDFAGLFFFPIVCAAMIQVLRRLAGRDDRGNAVFAAVSVAITGAVFTAIKLSPSFNSFVARLWGSNALDPTDLIALPALGLSWLWLRHGRRLPVRDTLQIAAIAAAGLASVATSGPRIYRVYPQWSPDEPARRQIACATGEVWVAKSGKEGTGVYLELRTDQGRCAVEIHRAELRLPSRAVTAATVPLAVHLDPGAVERVWLPFPFDGDAAWNAGERRATLRLGLVAGGESHSWDIELANAIAGGQQIAVEPHFRGPEAPR